MIRIIHKVCTYKNKNILQTCIKRLKLKTVLCIFRGSLLWKYYIFCKILIKVSNNNLIIFGTLIFLKHILK